MLTKETLEAAAVYVADQAHHFRETHYSRALAIELTARGSHTHTEAQCPTVFKASDGSKHVICNDRADIIVNTDNTTAIIEVKKCRPSPDLLESATDQALRYKHNFETYTHRSITAMFLVFFTPTSPIVYALS